MPAVGVTELAVKLTPARKGLKTLFLSGYATSAIVQEGGLSADAGFLGKPFTPDVFARKVRDVLDAAPKRGGGRGAG